MSYTSLDIDPAVYGTRILIARTSGRPLDGILSARCFGLSSPTEPYFDPAGAAPGELAQLGFDAARGHFFLASGQPPDLHLMLRRAGPAPVRSPQAQPAALARALRRASTKRARARQPALAAVDHAAHLARETRHAARSHATPPADEPDSQRQQLLARWRAAGAQRRLADLELRSHA